MREGIDDPSVLFDFPVHVRPGGGAGHADERYRLAARDTVADAHGVLDAHAPAADLDPARGVDDAVVRGDDDRAERSCDVDPGVAALKELADSAGDRTDEAARCSLDAPEARAGGWIGTQVDALPACNATAVELELRLVKAGPAHAGEPASIRAEGAGAEEIGERRDRSVLPVGRIPHRYAIKDIAARYGRRDRAHHETTVAGPHVHGPGKARGSRRLDHHAPVEDGELAVRSHE